MMLSAEETVMDSCVPLLNKKKKKHQSHSFLFVPIQTQPATYFHHHWAGDSFQYNRHWAGKPRIVQTANVMQIAKISDTSKLLLLQNILNVLTTGSWRRKWRVHVCGVFFFVCVEYRMCLKRTLCCLLFFLAIFNLKATKAAKCIWEIRRIAQLNWGEPGWAHRFKEPSFGHCWQLETNSFTYWVDTAKGLLVIAV